MTQARIAMFREARATARARGDRSLERTMNVELARLGDYETTDVAPELEHAVPPKPRRGRTPKPRCEHGMIVERCPDCNEEEGL